MSSGKSPKECLMCLNTNETIFVPAEECQKIFNICCSYVKDAINVEFLINNINANNNQLSFCITCFHSSLNLSLLVEQLSKLKKEINDLASCFSEKIGQQRIQAKKKKHNPATIQLKDAGKKYKTTSNQTQRTNYDSSDRLSLHEVQVQSGTTRDSIMHSETSSSNELIDEQIGIDAINNEIVKTEREEYLDSEDGSCTENLNCFKEQDYGANYLMTGIENEINPLEENQLESTLETVNNYNTIEECKPKVVTSNSGSEWDSSVTNPNIVPNRTQNDVFSTRCGVSNPTKIQDNPGTNFNQNIPCGSAPNFNYPTDKANTTERKNYKNNCSVCRKNFDSPSKLKRHFIVHTGEKAFKCAWCESLFSRPDKLKEHERIHTGDKPYKCAYCEMTFISSNVKVRHQKKFHRDRYNKNS